MSPSVSLINTAVYEGGLSPSIPLWGASSVLELRDLTGKEILLNSRCRIYQYNEDDFRLKFLISTKLSNSKDTHKHENKEKLSINSYSLFTCKLVILLVIKTYIKNRLNCIDINANNCTNSS